MGRLQRLAATLWRRDRLAADLADEMAFHIEERIRENLSGGMTLEAARADAERRFGNPALLLDRTRDMDVIVWVDALRREAGQAFRGLLRRPGLVTTAVLTLAFGIGATSAIFSVVDAVLLRPLPVPGASALVVLRERRGEEGLGGNAARLRDWRARARTLQNLSGYYGESVTLSGTGEPERRNVLRTFGPMLALFGTQPALGRAFTAAEEDGRGAPVALLTHTAWQSRFGGSPAVLGRSLTLGAVNYTIIGVLPAAFQYPPDQDFIVPAPPEFQEAGRNGGNYFTMIGRLAPGTTLAAGRTEVQALARSFAREFPATDKALDATLVFLQDAETGSARAPLLLLLGAVSVLLLIACVNIASLLLARAAERSHEAAIRVALGAGRGSLLRLYLLESGWLALAGGAAGLLLAWLGVPFLRRVLPAELPRLDGATLDWRVAGFALFAAACCGLLFGLIPALQAARSAGPAESLRDGGRSTSGVRRLLARRALVVVQVSLSMLLLVGAGLLGRSLYRMRSAPTGVVPEEVLAVRFELPWDTDQARLHASFARILDALAALPGVQRVGLTDRLPLEGGSQSRPVRLRDQSSAALPLPEEAGIAYRAVSAGMFQALEVPILEGRVWQDRADGTGPRELVVNQTFARRYLAPGKALGALLTFDTKPKPGSVPEWYEVVGVVGDIRQRNNQPVQPPELYVPYQNTYWPLGRFVIRAQGDPAFLTAAVRRAILQLEPDQIVDGIAPLALELAQTTAESRTRTLLVGVFAVTALLLSAIGLYGVLASDVAQRRQEIGVRLALGADPARLKWMVVRRGLALAAIGLCAGLAASLALGQWMASLLYGVAPTDLAAMLGSAVALALVALAASYLSARRVAALDPVLALRRE